MGYFRLALGIVLLALPPRGIQRSQQLASNAVLVFPPIGNTTRATDRLTQTDPSVPRWYRVPLAPDNLGHPVLTANEVTGDGSGHPRR